MLQFDQLFPESKVVIERFPMFHSSDAAITTNVSTNPTLRTGQKKRADAA
jgi:hypothetical protein